MNVCMKFLGCRLNEAEQASWHRQFVQLGHQVVMEPEDAHVIAVNTCAVTAEATRKSRKMLRDLHRQNPSAKIVATGCYATLAHEKIQEELHVDMVVPNAQKSEMAQKIAETWGGDMPQFAKDPNAQPAFAQSRTRAFVKVQDGCRNQCSFCIVTQARGNEKSVPIQEVVQEINHLHAHGQQEVVLAGVHLGGYGSDINEDLRSLLEGILKDTSIPRIRLGSLEPWDFPKGFLDLWDNPRLCPHLHLPLQSGSDSVLRRMIRRCTVAEYKELVHLARAQNPNFHVTSDLIVGFPGETDAEFQETLTTIQEIAFGDMHIFAYSPRQGTPAARMKNPLNKNQIKERVKIIHPIVQQMQQDFKRSQVGRSDEVLWEREVDLLENGSILWQGYTKNYLRVQYHSQTPKALFNQITPVLLMSPLDIDGPLQVKFP